MNSTVNAKSIVLELLSAGPAVHSGPIPVRMLVQAASIFGIAENSLRVTLVRLRAEQLIDSPIRGHYTLGPAALPIQAQISRWRTLDEQVVPWDGTWIAAMTGGLPRTDRAVLNHRSRALRLLGMREFRPGFFLRPNNLSIGIEQTRSWLYKLGLEEQAIICQVDQLPSADQESIQDLWDTKTMEAVYRDMCVQLEASLQHLEDNSLEDALREAHTLAREGIRWLVLDPLLPDAMVSVEARDALVKTLLSHTEKTYQRWRSFLEIDSDKNQVKVLRLAPNR